MIGRTPVRVGHLKKLEYINVILRETLRLSPTVPVMTKQISPKFQGKATLCKGRYAIEPSDRIVALLGATERDPKVYRNDANKFKPERMLGDNFRNLPNAAWKVSCPVPKVCLVLNFCGPLELTFERILDGLLLQVTACHCHHSVLRRPTTR